MKYLAIAVVVVLMLTRLMSGVAQAEGPTYYGPWTRAQWDAVGLIYEYAEYEGLTPEAMMRTSTSPGPALGLSILAERNCADW